MASCECELCSVAWKELVKRPTSLWLKLCAPCRLLICGQTSTMLSIDNITLQGSASDQVYPSLVRLSLRVGKNSLSIMHLCRSIFSDFVHLSICIAACDHEVFLSAGLFPVPLISSSFPNPHSCILLYRWASELYCTSDPKGRLPSRSLHTHGSL